MVGAQAVPGTEVLVDPDAHVIDGATGRAVGLVFACSAPKVIVMTVLRSSEFLSFFGGLSDATPRVDFDDHGLSAFVSFELASRVRWTASVWLDGRIIEGFVLRDEESGVEVVVRDVERAGGDPLVVLVVDAVRCAAAP